MATKEHNPAEPGRSERGNSETLARVEASLSKRYRTERRFRLYGMLAVIASIAFVVFFFFSIISQGYTAFQQTYLQLDIYFDPQVLSPDGDVSEESLSRANYAKLVKQSLAEEFPGVSGRKAKRQLNRIVSSGASYELRDQVMADPAVIGSRQSIWFLADDEIDAWFKVDREAGEEGTGRLSYRHWRRTTTRLDTTPSRRPRQGRQRT